MKKDAEARPTAGQEVSVLLMLAHPPRPFPNLLEACTPSLVPAVSQGHWSEFAL